MSIFTRPDSPFWYYRCEGTTIRVNTKIPVDAPTEEQRKRNKQTAQLLYNARMGDLARDRHDLPSSTQPAPAATFTELAAWYAQHELPKHRGAEREREILPRLVERFGPMAAESITPPVVDEWITHRRKERRRVRGRIFQPPSTSTINREIDVLKGVLQAGVPTHYETSPLFGMKRLRAATPQRRLMSAEEEARLLAVLPVEDKAFVLVGLDALVRLGDILDIRRRDDRGDAIWIADPKAGGGFPVPVSSRLRAALDAVYAATSPKADDYVFASRRVAKTDRDRRNGIRQMLEYACARAGLDYGRSRGGLTFHWATRRTGATRMLTSGVDPGTVQKVGRWKTASMVLDVYHELIDEKARAAVESVGREAGANNG